MHLADITMFYAPASGGVRTYLSAKRAWLQTQPGIRHSLLVPGEHTSCEQGVYLLPAPTIPFSQSYRFPLSGRAWVEQLQALRPNIIEAGDPYRLAWAALAAGKSLDVPVIGFYHSDLPRLVGARAGGWTDPVLDGYVRRLYGRFDRVLAPSRLMADKLAGLGVQRVQVQPLGVDTTQFHPRLADAQARHRLGIPEHAHLLIFAGRGSREKHIPMLLQTLQRLGRDYHLLLVGSHMPTRTPSNVSVLNRFVGQSELARLMASSDAMLHAGDQETFGLVILEAMASGLPVVGVRAGAVAELVAPGTGLLAKPGCVDSLAQTVRALFADGWPEMGRLARRHVELHYAWDQVLPSLLGHYRELCGDWTFETAANG